MFQIAGGIILALFLVSIIEPLQKTILVTLQAFGVATWGVLRDLGFGVRRLFVHS